MKNVRAFLRTFAVAILVSLAVSSSALAADGAKDAKKGPAWIVRCSGDGQDGKPVKKDVPVSRKDCEVFQRLVVQDSGQRVAEFAIGYPDEKKGTARGVIILPLGILVNDDIIMQIDEGKKVKFRIRYCTGEGCFSVVDLNTGLVDSLRSGKTLAFTARAMNGQDVAIKLTLGGLATALDRLAASGG